MTRREALAGAFATVATAAGAKGGSTAESQACRGAGEATPAKPNRLGNQLMEVLGLQGKLIKSIDIHCHAYDPDTVTTVEYVDDEQGDGVVEVMKNYRLEET